MDHLQAATLDMTYALSRLCLAMDGFSYGEPELPDPERQANALTAARESWKAFHEAAASELQWQPE